MLIVSNIIIAGYRLLTPIEVNALAKRTYGYLNAIKPSRTHKVRLYLPADYATSDKH